MEELVYEADDITSKVIDAHEQLEDSNVGGYLDVNSFCPNAQTSSIVNDLGLQSTGNDIRLALLEMNDFINTYIHDAQAGIDNVQDTTESLSKAIEWFYENDWKPKMMLLFLNVVNVFLLLSACCSKHNKVHSPFHCMVSYLLVPMFITTLILSVIATCGFAIGAVSNAGTVVLLLFFHGKRVANKRVASLQIFAQAVEGVRKELSRISW